MRKKTAFPSDDMIVLAALMGASEHGSEWVEAETIASVLRRLGFLITPQMMVGQLKRLLGEDCPMFERHLDNWMRLYEYRVTRHGLAQLESRFPASRPLTRYWRERLAS